MQWQNVWLVSKRADPQNWTHFSAWWCTCIKSESSLWFSKLLVPTPSHQVKAPENIVSQSASWLCVFMQDLPIKFLSKGETDLLTSRDKFLSVLLGSAAIMCHLSQQLDIGSITFVTMKTVMFFLIFLFSYEFSWITKMFWIPQTNLQKASLFCHK